MYREYGYPCAQAGPLRITAVVIPTLLLLLTTVAAAETAPATAAPAACWGPHELGYKAGDEIVRRGIAAAFQDAPKRTLAAYSPIPQRGVIRRVKLPPGKKLIALTFDLCEHPYEVTGYQGAIVDFLRQNKIKATFFMGGKWMLSHLDRSQQLMADPLFDVANHTWEHRNLRVVNDDVLVDEIRNAQVAYEQVRDELQARQCLARDNKSFAHELAPTRLNYFRFPYGACNRKALGEVARMGLLPIQWDVTSGDPWIGQTTEMMKREVLDKAQPGSIVLFHANGRGLRTESALPAIVAGLKAKGFQFVTVKELLAAGEPVWSQDCYDSKPGDVDKYDEHARRLELESQSARAVFAATLKPKADDDAPAVTHGIDTSGADGDRSERQSADNDSGALPVVAVAGGVPNGNFIARRNAASPERLNAQGASPPAPAQVSTASGSITPVWPDWFAQFRCQVIDKNLVCEHGSGIASALVTKHSGR